MNPRNQLKMDTYVTSTGEMIVAYRILVGKSEEKRTLERYV